MANSNLSDIDKILDEERVCHDGCKVKYTAKISDLPNGVIVELDNMYFLKFYGQILEWSLEGYVSYQGK